MWFCLIFLMIKILFFTLPNRLIFINTNFLNIWMITFIHWSWIYSINKFIFNSVWKLNFKHWTILYLYLWFIVIKVLTTLYLIIGINSRNSLSIIFLNTFIINHSFNRFSNILLVSIKLYVTATIVWIIIDKLVILFYISMFKILFRCRINLSNYFSIKLIIRLMYFLNIVNFHFYFYFKIIKYFYLN